MPLLYKSSTKNNSKENVGCVIIMHTLYSATGTTKDAVAQNKVESRKGQVRMN